MNKDDLEVIVTNMTEVSLDVGFANQLLVSSLVKYLADKNIIDLDDYLAQNQQIQDYLISQSRNDRENKLIEKVFTAHRKDFEKPE
ncbi:hypothetical protein [Moraxella catarrhalis]|uniref:hypothetical protein n=1 Tax=Moraxella catarrhalis TaxID=480 RepID=UPI00128DBD25|nr:hypothetical protein [Moraxella catarrhalis]MPW78366.1 hypothetical protein [Moraxella catarrhalis]MPX77021.1 hypothetical protein [Moraxella catarrhalis]